MRACGLELCRQLAIANAEIEWKVAMLERMIGGCIRRLPPDD
jgi:hypothetical protein